MPGLFAQSHIAPGFQALFANVRRSPPPANLATSCQIRRRTPPPRPNWRSQTTFLCPVKGGFGPQKERSCDLAGSVANCTRRACPVRASDVRNIDSGWRSAFSYVENRPTRRDFPFETSVAPPPRAIRRQTTDRQLRIPSTRGA